MHEDNRTCRPWHLARWIPATAQALPDSLRQCEANWLVVHDRRGRDFAAGSIHLGCNLATLASFCMTGAQAATHFGIRQERQRACRRRTQPPANQHEIGRRARLLRRRPTIR
jgi:hypothetical protein